MTFIIALILTLSLGVSLWIVERANAKAIRFSNIPLLTTFVVLSVMGGIGLIGYQVITLW